MRFPRPLVRATLVRRYNRFLADAVLVDGTTITSHCPNSGSMLGVKEPGSEIWLSHADGTKRRYPHTWELIRADNTLVGINTTHPNALVSEAVAEGRLAELAGYDRQRREVRYGTNSRIDLLLESDGRPPCYVEVKNVHLRRGLENDPAAPAEFPDSVTERGTKHLAELTEMVRQGARAVMVFLVQRSDAPSFAVAADIDRTYAMALDVALAAGVEAVCYRCRIDVEGIEVEAVIPIRPPAETLATLPPVVSRQPRRRRG